MGRRQFLPQVSVGTLTMPNGSPYPVPPRDSGIGVHTNTNGWFPLGENENKWPEICRMFVDMGISWVKVVTTGNDLMSAIRVFEYQGNRNVFAEVGIEVIMRFFWSRPYPQAVTQELLSNVERATRRFMEKGVHYFEVDNETNHQDEWQSVEAWNQMGSLEARAMHAGDVWIEKAQAVRRAGGIPLLTAMAPGAHDDDELVFPRFVQRIKNRGFLGLLAESAIAVHNYWLKHDIWYPYDEVNQAEHPGAHLHSGRGMSNGFLKYQWVRDIVQRETGLWLPVLTTEGGQRIADPTLDFRYWQEITLDVHRESVLQQAEYMAKEAPPWYLCTNDWVMASKEWGGDLSWDWAAWISPVRNPSVAPAVDALKQRGFVERNKVVVQPPPPPPPPPPAGLPDFIKDVSTTLPRHSTKRYPVRLKPATYIIVHHSASSRDATTPEAIARYHVNTHDWAGAGYNIIVTGDGKAYLSNPLNVQGNHVGNWNDRCVGICFTGNFVPGNDTPSGAQIETGRKVLAWVMGQLQLGPESIMGHRDVPGATTKCPGSDWWKAMLALPGVDLTFLRWSCEQAAREARDGEGQQAHDRLVRDVIPALYQLESEQ